MRDSGYAGLLCIGDPHLSSRVPGFRRDDYPETVLGKLEWLLDYADRESLLPVLLGDLFHWPRDNANWLLVRLVNLLRGRTVLGVVGNHDTALRSLEIDDTLAILEAIGCVVLVDRGTPWVGTVNGRPLVVGGCGWSQPLPAAFDCASCGADPESLVVWVAHHDVAFVGYEEVGRHKPREIPGVHMVINGHIHRPLPDIQAGGTIWLNPGNIARVARGDGHRERRPGALRIDVGADGWTVERVEVPHQPYEEVFHPIDVAEAPALDVSVFVQGLEKLLALRTASGAGLLEFLEQNLPDADPEVRGEIFELAREVLE